jgi:hypothetical protein
MRSQDEVKQKRVAYGNKNIFSSYHKYLFKVQESSLKLKV